jgi:hypothetical protein
MDAEGIPHQGERMIALGDLFAYCLHRLASLALGEVHSGRDASRVRFQINEDVPYYGHR